MRCPSCKTFTTPIGIPFDQWTAGLPWSETLDIHRYLNGPDWDHRHCPGAKIAAGVRAVHQTKTGRRKNGRRHIEALQGAAGKKDRA